MAGACTLAYKLSIESAWDEKHYLKDNYRIIIKNIIKEIDLLELADKEFGSLPPNRIYIDGNNNVTIDGQNNDYATGSYREAFEYLARDILRNSERIEKPYTNDSLDFIEQIGKTIYESYDMERFRFKILAKHPLLLSCTERLHAYSQGYFAKFFFLRRVPPITKLLKMEENYFKYVKFRDYPKFFASIFQEDKTAYRNGLLGALKYCARARSAAATHHMSCKEAETELTRMVPTLLTDAYHLLEEEEEEDEEEEEEENYFKYIKFRDYLKFFASIFQEDNSGWSQHS